MHKTYRNHRTKYGGIILHRTCTRVRCLGLTKTAVYLLERLNFAKRVLTYESRSNTSVVDTTFCIKYIGYTLHLLSGQLQRLSVKTLKIPCKGHSYKSLSEFTIYQSDRVYNVEKMKRDFCFSSFIPRVIPKIQKCLYRVTEN